MLDHVEVTKRLRAAGCVFAEDEARLLIEAAGAADLDVLVGRRVAGEPLEQIVGWAEFLGHRIAVEPGVFVPRRRTELLARRAIRAAQAATAAHATSGSAPGARAAPDGSASGAAGSGGAAVGRVAGAGSAVVVDLCCGSGAVGATVLTAVPGAEVHAVDIDPAAVRCTGRNLRGGAVHLGDLYDPLPDRLRGRVDVIAANAPYVPTGEIDLMPPEARVHEPPTALDGGTDGLDILRRVLTAAPAWLTPLGVLLVETSAAQAPTLVAAALAAGLRPEIVTDPDVGATVLLARPGPG
jgi:release factor glutamine methyltransferase